MELILIIIAFLLIGYLLSKPLILFSIIGIIVIIYIAYQLYKDSDTGRKNEILNNRRIITEARKLQERMNSYGVYPTYIVSNGVSKIYFDENNRLIYLKCSSGEKVFSIDNIVSYGTSVDVDKNIQYTAGTYFTGKFKQNESINTIWYSIQLNSIDNAYITF